LFRLRAEHPSAELTLSARSSSAEFFVPSFSGQNALISRDKMAQNLNASAAFSALVERFLVC
jgi:hypothetical protein